MTSQRLVIAIALTALSSCAGKSSSPADAGAPGSGAGGSGAGGSGAGGLGGSSQVGGSVAGGSGGSSQAGGNGPAAIVCPEGEGDLDFSCPGEGIACGPLRGSIALATSAVALYVRASGLILRVTTSGAEIERRVIDTGSASVSAIAVAEPYVYWLSEKGVGRTKTEPSALAEPLAEECFPPNSISGGPKGAALVTDATSVYWSTYSNFSHSATSHLGAVLRVANSAAAPSAKVSLLGSLKDPVFAVDDDKLYFHSESRLMSLVKNERCSCACSAPAPGSALACETADGVPPVSGSGGAPPSFYADCGGQHVALNYSSSGEEISSALADETHLYWSTSKGTISRLPKNGPDLLDPTLEIGPEPEVILPEPSDALRAPNLFAFTLDASHVYAYRRRNDLDGTALSEEVLRIAKDGSIVTQLHEQQLRTNVHAMAVDATSVYVASVTSDSCTFEVQRFSK